MMYHDQLYSLAKLRDEEALQQARVRRLGHRAKAHHRSCSEEQRRLWPWLIKLAAVVVGTP